MLSCQEFLPHPALRDIILHYGVLEDKEKYGEIQVDITPPVINKGFMFHYRRDSHLIIDNGYFVGELPRGFILPQGSTPNIWKHRGNFGIFSVIFKPGMFRLLYQNSMLEHLNGAPTFESYNDRSLLLLYEQIMMANTHQERVQYANTFFLKKTKYLQLEMDTMQESLRRMYTHPSYNIRQVKEHIYMSEGHFRRTFSRTFGITPKKLQQLIRITHAINRIGTNTTDNLGQIGLDCGFSDQAHFIKQFKSYTGMTPLVFKKNQINITKLITHRDEIRDGRMR